MWSDVLDQPTVDLIVVNLREDGITGAAEIRAVIEQVAALYRGRTEGIVLSSGGREPSTG